MDYVIVEILASVITLVGVTLISIPKRIGIYVLLVGDFLWILFSYLTNHYFLLSQNVYLLLINIYAVYSWKKKGIK